MNTWSIKKHELNRIYTLKKQETEFIPKIFSVNRVQTLVGLTNCTVIIYNAHVYMLNNMFPINSLFYRVSIEIICFHDCQHNVSTAKEA